ncbi:MAG: hypothetical protein PHR28_01615 [candidate division Zixibacteria bacterium]|nr:hypothetical protein [candidate division Zixibacteria bacterium]
MCIFETGSSRHIFNAAIVILGYILTFALSGLVVRFILNRCDKKSPAEVKAPASPDMDLGMIIGKCENFLGITFVLADQVTGLALLFAAKSILRAKDMRNNPKYFLGGTMVNFSFTMFMAFLIKYCLCNIRF